jgi:hypothetical protein
MHKPFVVDEDAGLISEFRFDRKVFVSGLIRNSNEMVEDLRRDNSSIPV